MLRCFVHQAIINIDNMDDSEISTDRSIKINKRYNDLVDIRDNLDKEIKIETKKNNNELFKTTKGK